MPTRIQSKNNQLEITRVKISYNKRLLAVAIGTALISACGGGGTDSVTGEISQPGANNGVVIDVPQPTVVQDSSVVEDTGPGDSIASGVGVITGNTDGSNTADSDDQQIASDDQTIADNTGIDNSNTDDTGAVTTDQGNETVDVVIVTDNSNDTGSSETDSNTDEDTTDINDAGGAAISAALAPSGLLDTAQPTFVWPAVANAEQYKIVVKDADGNGYARTLDSFAANCQTGEGSCSATTGLAYYDNDMTWYVESTVDGNAGPVSDSFSITTPVSENLQPIKSSVSGCEGWASVAYGKYIVLNNTWNARTMNDPSWSQLINVTENANGTISPAWSYDWLGQFDGDEIAVKAYPEVLYGPKLGTHVSGTKEETGLPEKVSDLPEFVVRYDYSETGNAERNVALESFFHDSEDIRGPCDDHDNRVFEMMIWVNNPSIRTPGKLALTGVMVDNQLWNVYIKPDSDKHYIAFTAQNPTTSGTLNWKRFVEWTQDWTAANAEELQIDVLNPDFYMGAIEIGTEMWWGEGTFTLNEFEVTF